MKKAIAALPKSCKRSAVNAKYGALFAFEKTCLATFSKACAGLTDADFGFGR